MSRGIYQHFLPATFNHQDRNLSGALLSKLVVLERVLMKRDDLSGTGVRDVNPGDLCFG